MNPEIDEQRREALLALSARQSDREIAEAIRVQAMSGAERYAWLEQNWDPLQRAAEALYQDGRPHGARSFRTLEEKNAYDEARELERAVALYQLRKSKP